MPGLPEESVTVSSEYDLIIIITAHDIYRDIDFNQLGIPILDTRNSVEGTSDLFFKA